MADNLPVVIFVHRMVVRECFRMGGYQPGSLQGVREENVVWNHFGRVVVPSIYQGIFGFSLCEVPFVSPYVGDTIWGLSVPSRDFMDDGGLRRECLASGPKLTHGYSDGVD